MLSSLQERCSWTAVRRNPKRAIFVSFLLIVASFSVAIFLAFSSGFGFISWQFFCLAGLSVFFTIASFWTTELTRSGTSEVGFCRVDLAAIPMLLAVMLFSPLAGFLVAAVTTLVLPLQVRWRAVPANFVSYTTPYLLAGVGLSAVVDESTPLVEKLLFFMTAGFFTEALSYFLCFILFAYMDGELAIPSNPSSLYKAVGTLSLIATVFAGAVLIFGFVVPLVVLAVCLVLTPFAELIVRLRLGVDGQRALSWGMATAVWKLVGEQDDRLRRHSINVARYMRDFAKALKLSRGEQELAFMFGLLHDIGLSGLSRHIRVAEEEFLRDDAPPVPDPGEKTFQWEPPENVEEDDHIGQSIDQAKDTYETLSGGPAEGMKEPAWWRSKDAKVKLSLEDIDQLECHDINGGFLLQSAAKYGHLQELIANHHDPPAVDRPRSMKEKLLHMIAICDRYESLTAIDGSFPAQKSEDALVFLEEYAETVFHQQTFDAFCKMMRKKSAAYRNGTDIDYGSQLYLEDFLDHKLPSAFNVIGWLRFGLLTPSVMDVSPFRKRQ